MPVEVLRERLQVDVGRVHVAVDLGPRFGRDVAGGDEDVLQTGLASDASDVDRVLRPDHRIVVRVRDPGTSRAQSERHDVLGRSELASLLDVIYDCIVEVTGN